MRLWSAERTLEDWQPCTPSILLCVTARRVVPVLPLAVLVLATVFSYLITAVYEHGHVRVVSVFVRHKRHFTFCSSTVVRTISSLTIK